MEDKELVESKTKSKGEKDFLPSFFFFFFFHFFPSRKRCGHDMHGRFEQLKQLPGKCDAIMETLAFYGARIR